MPLNKIECKLIETCLEAIPVLRLERGIDAEFVLRVKDAYETFGELAPITIKQQSYLRSLAEKFGVNV